MFDKFHVLLSYVMYPYICKNCNYQCSKTSLCTFTLCNGKTNVCVVHIALLIRSAETIHFVQSSFFLKSLYPLPANKLWFTCNLNYTFWLGIANLIVLLSVLYCQCFYGASLINRPWPVRAHRFFRNYMHFLLCECDLIEIFF